MNPKYKEKIQNICFYFVMAWVAIAFLVLMEIWSSHILFGKDEMTLKQIIYELIKK